jgi:hypothetical protein
VPGGKGVEAGTIGNCLGKFSRVMLRGSGRKAFEWR